MKLIDVIKKFHKDIGQQPEHDWYDFFSEDFLVSYLALQDVKEKLTQEHKDMILALAISGCEHAQRLVKNDFN